MTIAYYVHYFADIGEWCICYNDIVKKKDDFTGNRINRGGPIMSGKQYVNIVVAGYSKKQDALDYCKEMNAGKNAGKQYLNKCQQVPKLANDGS